MPTALDTTNAIQDKLFQNLQVSQRAVVDVVRSWAETTELVFSKLPDLSLSDPSGRPASQVFETGLGFTERVLASQRDFANQLFEAAMPVTRAPAAGAAATRATNPKA
jgi:hypothetical protein